jgi:macrodomain Ter protein organizer (MatP/YcbG family)
MKRILFGAIILFATISSCTVYKEYAIEIYKPGIIAVPPNVENIALVYRNFKYRGDSLQHYYKKDNQLLKSKNDPESIDSILANYVLKELATDLKSNNTFSRVYIFPGIFKQHTGKKLPPLKFDLVQKLTSSTETELLVSLETFSYFFSKYSGNSEIPKSNEVITAAVWAVYDPDAQKLIERKTMIDTVFWNNLDEKGNRQKGAKLPPRKTALKIAAQLAGENYSKRFFASWQKVNRIYSVPPPSDFTTAANFVEKGEWDNAISIWTKYAPNKNGKMAIHARYNLAFAYEMKDEIDTARKWLAAAEQLAISYNSKEDIKRILEYQKILTQRKKDIDRLNMMNAEKF